MSHNYKIYGYVMHTPIQKPLQNHHYGSLGRRIHDSFVSVLILCRMRAYMNLIMWAVSSEYLKLINEQSEFFFCDSIIFILKTATNPVKRTTLYIYYIRITNDDTKMNSSY